VIEKSRKDVASGLVRYPVDIRVLEHAARLSDGTLGTLCNHAQRIALDHCPHWSADLGDTEAKSLAAVQSYCKYMATGAWS
jgi:hypothetical protein